MGARLDDVDPRGELDLLGVEGRGGEGRENRREERVSEWPTKERNGARLFFLRG